VLSLLCLGRSLPSHANEVGGLVHLRTVWPYGKPRHRVLQVSLQEMPGDQAGRLIQCQPHEKQILKEETLRPDRIAGLTDARCHPKWKNGRLKMPEEIIRCPYCVQGNHFKIMTAGGGRRWFKCDRCGHTAMPQNPTFQCACLGCFSLSNSTSVKN
jgi:hypothetical protein